MNISGILVVAPVPHIDAVIESLEAIPGVDVHHIDRPTGRIVVTQEAPTVGDEVDGLQRIKALPHVILAEMVHHYFGEDAQMRAAGSAIDRDPVPPFLDDPGDQQTTSSEEHEDEHDTP